MKGMEIIFELKLEQMAKYSAVIPSNGICSANNDL